MQRKKLLMIGGIVFASFLTLCFSLFAYLSYKIRDIKTPLLEAFKSQIDGELKIGSADVVFIPAGINLSDVQLFAPGETEAAASIKRAELRFDLIPLIQKKIETRVTVIEPEILLRRDKSGKSNMEKIFAPMLSGQSKERISAADKFWWKRLAVNRLRIEQAHFTARNDAYAEAIELKNLSVEADDIRFESVRTPAKIRIRYEMPKISREPMELSTRMFFEEGEQYLKLESGKVSWGPAQIRLEGKAGLPSENRNEVLLDFQFASDPIDLKKFSKILLDPLPLAGNATLKGTVTGTAFAPILSLIVDSPALTAAGKTLSSFHAEFFKKDAPIEIKSSGFGLYGGSVGVSGKVMPGAVTSADLAVALKSLSLAAMSGKSGSPARLSGNLQVAVPNVKNSSAVSGGGKISVGPFPLPVVNLQSKVRVAEILAAGTALGQMVNVGMLSSSANLIGNQVDAVNASVRFSGNTITLSPFSLGNGHFNASGSGTIQQQKSINGSGTFTLNRSVTAQLLTNPGLRQVMTKGTGALSVPFTMSGPLEDPNISVDSSYLKGLAAKATAMGLTQLLAGGVRPADMLNTALKNAPLGNAKGPLGQILGLDSSAATPRSTSTTNNRKSTSRTAPSQNQKRGSALDQLLFGR